MDDVTKRTDESVSAAVRHRSRLLSQDVTTMAERAMPSADIGLTSHRIDGFGSCQRGRRCVTLTVRRETA